MDTKDACSDDQLPRFDDIRGGCPATHKPYDEYGVQQVGHDGHKKRIDGPMCSHAKGENGRIKKAVYDRYGKFDADNPENQWDNTFSKAYGFLQGACFVSGFHVGVG